MDPEELAVVAVVAWEEGAAAEVWGEVAVAEEEEEEEEEAEEERAEEEAGEEAGEVAVVAGTEAPVRQAHHNRSWTSGTSCSGHQPIRRHWRPPGRGNTRRDRRRRDRPARSCLSLWWRCRLAPA